MKESERALCDHYGRILGLEKPWVVEGVRLDVVGKRLELVLEWDSQRVSCPQCGKECGIKDREERRWRHLDMMQFETILRCRVPRCECAEHGVKTVKVPWAEPHSRFTLLFEMFVLEVALASRSVSSTAELVKLHWESVQAIMERAVERGQERSRLEELRYVGMDEKSFLRGQSYASLLYDLEAGRVLEVSLGRDEEAAWLLWETLPEPARKQIQAICTDMSGIYQSVASEAVPGAVIVNDRFHVSKQLNEAVDQVRRAENKTLEAKGDERLKGTRQLWLFNEDNLSKEQACLFETLKAADLKAARAWAIKESFRGFWICKTVSEATVFFDKWYDWASDCRLTPVTKVATMLKKHFRNLLNFILHPITNAVSEGLNSKVQAIKADARGFRNFLHYRTRILFFCGKLDLFPNCPH